MLGDRSGFLALGPAPPRGESQSSVTEWRDPGRKDGLDSIEDGVGANSLYVFGVMAAGGWWNAVLLEEEVGLLLEALPLLCAAAGELVRGDEGSSWIAYLLSETDRRP